MSKKKLRKQADELERLLANFELEKSVKRVILKTLRALDQQQQQQNVLSKRIGDMLLAIILAAIFAPISEYFRLF
ncbi:MAG: hypothetical protein IPO03_19090 [Bacteroidetes bacterium]|nr:hypothetical protein [Bacteroidota bacterium]